MGYRSEVYGVVSQKDWDGLIKLTNTKSLSGGQNYTESFEDWISHDWEYTFPEWTTKNGTTYPARHVHYFHITGIKWYRGTKSLVDAVENYLYEIDDEESWGMIIVGEETDDNEFLGHPYEFDMYLQRNVVMPDAPWEQIKDVPEEKEPLPDVPVPINWVRTVFWREPNGV